MKTTRILTALLLPFALVPAAHAQSAPKYSADVPSYITTPDSVKTRIGTLKFKNGAPDPDTVRRFTTSSIFPRHVGLCRL
jgi:hypothetical protein